MDILDTVFTLFLAILKLQGWVCPTKLEVYKMSDQQDIKERIIPRICDPSVINIKKLAFF